MSPKTAPPLTRRHFLALGIGTPFAMALTGCDALGNALKPLVGKVLSLEVQDISLSSINLGMGLNVFNPNPIALPELGLGLALNLAETDIASFGTSSPFSLPKEGDTALNLNVGINALNIVSTLIRLKDAERVPYRISGEAETPQLGGLTLPLSASGSIQLD